MLFRAWLVRFGREGRLMMDKAWFEAGADEAGLDLYPSTFNLTVTRLWDDSALREVTCRLSKQQWQSHDFTIYEAFRDPASETLTAQGI